MKKSLLCLLIAVIYSFPSMGKITPLSLQARVDEAQYVVAGKVINAVSYWNENHTNIYTLHEIKIDGYWKGQNGATHIGLIDLGGTVGYDKQETHPAVSLEVGSYGVFMLNNEISNKNTLQTYNSSSINFMQCEPTASIQGAILYKNGIWMDPSSPQIPRTTNDFFEELEKLTTYKLKNSLGQFVNANTVILNSNYNQTSNKTTAITSLTDGNNVTTTTFNAGVSNNPAMEMIINGSGFGNTAGTIEFADADAGGGLNTFTFPTTTLGLQGRYGAPTDIISWTNTQIRIRVPRSAGTGTMEIFDASNNSQGTSAITIDWTILPIYNDFFNFASETSQFAKLIDENGSGGYTFEMSTIGSANFFADVAAKEAFRRAMNTWRCGTEINWSLDLAAGTAAAFADDGTNVVVYDNSLPSGVLGRATSRFTANANGACTLHDTYWRARELDLQFQVIPFTGFTWNFNSSGTTNAQFSFESVALHELGHVHGLGHVVDNNKVMHFSSTNGTESVVLNTSDLDGGDYKVDNSLGPNCFTTPLPMTELLNACIPLPLDIVSFTAFEFGASNQLQWVTENEINIDRYEIQHGTNGVDFYVLGDVQSKPSQRENEYNYQHEVPSATNYYRLRIIDFDGNETFSSIVFLARSKNDAYLIYPNPTKDYLNIKVSNLNAQSNYISYTLTDISGKIIADYSNKINQQEIHLTENLKTLPSGLYFIDLTINGTKITDKIIKE